MDISLSISLDLLIALPAVLVLFAYISHFSSVHRIRPQIAVIIVKLYMLAGRRE